MLQITPFAVFIFDFKNALNDSQKWARIMRAKRPRPMLLGGSSSSLSAGRPAIPLRFHRQIGLGRYRSRSTRPRRRHRAFVDSPPAAADSADATRRRSRSTFRGPAPSRSATQTSSKSLSPIAAFAISLGYMLPSRLPQLQNTCYAREGMRPRNFRRDGFAIKPDGVIFKQSPPFWAFGDCVNLPE